MTQKLVTTTTFSASQRDPLFCSTYYNLPTRR